MSLTVPERSRLASETPRACLDLTAAMSPRPFVRVADVLADGSIANSYSRTSLIDGIDPAVPWAVLLADANGCFQLLAFDFDAKTPQTVGAAAAHAQECSELLTRHDIPHVVCASGPGGGRHVWIALAESAPAETARELATLAAAAWPSLDVTPLMNPATGCVRPPGAPHRNGGRSTVLTGDVDVLRRPSTRLAQLRAAAAELVVLVGVRAAEPQQPHGNPAPGLILFDEQHAPHLPGPRRTLPAATLQALHDPLDDDQDASARLWRILLGAVWARWRRSDIEALVMTAAGLEHLRTWRHTEGSRHRRPATGTHSPAAILSRQWERAVDHVARLTSTPGGDPTFDNRALQIVDLVNAVQQRADAMPGRWTSNGGPADRRVLDAMCLLACQAVTPLLEADIRRLALLVGIGRETARTALYRLADDGWITLTHPAAGRRAHYWRLENPRPEPLSTGTETARSQVDPRPDETTTPGAGAAARLQTLSQLTSRRDAARHDLFTPTGLGLAAGNAYAQALTSPPADGGGRRASDPALQQLIENGLLRADDDGRLVPVLGRRGELAASLGVAGTLERRAELYRRERLVWEWWCLEVDWLCTPRGGRPRRRPTPTTMGMLDVGPEDLKTWRYPRRIDGHPAHTVAAALIAGETTPPPQRRDPQDLVMTMLDATVIAA